jgi:nitroreductase
VLLGHHLRVSVINAKDRVLSQRLQSDKRIGSVRIASSTHSKDFVDESEKTLRGAFHMLNTERQSVFKFVGEKILKLNSLSAIKTLARNLAKALLPLTMKQSISQKRRLKKFEHNLKLNYAYDHKRFLTWSSAGKELYSQAQLKALITMDYHRIEKGLALKQPKTGFGRNSVERLLRFCEIYLREHGDDEVIHIAIRSLTEYYHYNLEHGFEDEELYKALVTLKSAAAYSDAFVGGTISVTKQAILEAGQIDLEAFFKSRYSIRHFAPEDVDINLIEKAIEMAQKTPSVCNRQTSKVYVFSKDEDKQKALSFQNGNRGFGDQASKVLVVVSELENFTSIGERNQAWIDGGMYAMSLVYALHSLGVGTCCLNWSVEAYVDKALKKATGIKDSESVIMMIAVGHIPDVLKVAQSPRKKIHEVMISR